MPQGFSNYLDAGFYDSDFDVNVDGGSPSTIYLTNPIDGDSPAFISFIGDGSFADRLYTELAPFAKLDVADQQGRKHLWALCQGIGSMFNQVETLTDERSDGEPGYANLVDINAIPADWLGYLGQFVGVELKSGLSDSQQRTWVYQRRNFKRGRPATLIEDVQDTLTGTQYVSVRERIGTDWHFTIVTKPSETPDPAVTERQILNNKPGPDTYTHTMVESPTYEWVKDTYYSYTDWMDAGFTYYDFITKSIDELVPE